MNIHFVVEGEEEVGSDNLPKFLEQNKAALKCDVAVVSDTGMVARGVPTLSYGLRGVTALEMKIKRSENGFALRRFRRRGAKPDTALARLLATLHDENGHVAIEGFYDTVKPLEDWEREAWRKLPIDVDKEVRQETGVPELFGEKGYGTTERIWGRPTAEINGIGGGYQGQGTKTVIATRSNGEADFSARAGSGWRRNFETGARAFAKTSAARREDGNHRRPQRPVVFDRSAFENWRSGTPRFA